MIYQAYDLVGEQYNQINTEILFRVASARALGVELLCLGFSDAISEELQSRRFRFAMGILQRIKKSGKIQFYATKDSFESASVESEYLKNKYSADVDFENAYGQYTLFLKI